MCRSDYVMEYEYQQVYNPANTTIDELLQCASRH
jgi:hypothetical protein